MSANKIVLDDKMILYKKSISDKIIKKIYDISTIESLEDIYTIASIGNIYNTDHIIGNTVIKLPDGDIPFPFPNKNKLIEEIYEIKNLITIHSIDCISDYAEMFELKIKKIKPWTIAFEKNSISEHSDFDKSGEKHSYTILILLNNNYSGGQLIFKDRVGNDPIEMASGDVLIYPSNNDYIHYQLPVLSGNKIIAISYFN